MTPEAFLCTIREHPDDDGPRLVYADWLEEHGECARAEFIRVQCELENNPDDERWQALARREAELLAEHGPQWLGPWPLSRNVKLRRGFLEVEIHAQAAAQLSEQYWQAPALLELAVTNLRSYPSGIQPLIHWPGREFITRLEPEWQLNRDDWSDLCRGLRLNWPRLEALTLPPIAFSDSDIESLLSMPNLKRLKLRNFRMPPSSGDWQTILSTPVVERIAAIEMEETPLSEESCRRLADICNRAGNLRQLKLNKCRLGANKFKQLVQYANLRELSVLDLTDNPLRDSGVRLLAESLNWKSLTELTLNGCECGKPGIQSLLESGLLRGLTALHLNNNFLGDATARVLLASGELASLRRFSLGSDLTDNGLGFMANSPAAAQWNELSVHGSSFTAGGLLSLLRSPELSMLSRLTIGGLVLHLGYLPNLNRKPFVSRLRELSIGREAMFGGGGLSHDAVISLLTSPSLPRLQRLHIPSVRPIEMMNDLLQRFGPRLECDLAMPPGREA
jgi:uncharacterized protein (TIGR02996 family)